MCLLCNLKVPEVYLPIGPALLPIRRLSHEAHIMSYILNTRRTNVQVDDEAGKVGKVLLRACFLDCFFRKEDWRIC